MAISFRAMALPIRASRILTRRCPLWRHVHSIDALHLIINQYNDDDTDNKIVKENKYEIAIIKWENEIAELTNRPITDSIQLKISELNDKINNAAGYCKRYKLLTESNGTMIILYKILHFLHTLP